MGSTGLHTSSAWHLFYAPCLARECVFQLDAKSWIVLLFIEVEESVFFFFIIYILFIFAYLKLLILITI